MISLSPAVKPPVIAGNSTPEATWQAWAGLAAVPLVTLEKLCSVGARLVVLAPHPDDELLACGGLLALHVAAGGRALVVSVTDGEASHRGEGAWDAVSEASLGSLRRSESAEGLRRLLLNTCDIHRMGFPDGGLAEHYQSLKSLLGWELRASDVMVTTWRHDAHPDHDSCGRVASEVCQMVGCRLLEAPVWMWHWSEPGDCRVPWNRMVSLTLPTEVLQRKRYALAAHGSQLARRSFSVGPVLGPEIVERAARKEEYFFV